MLHDVGTRSREELRTLARKAIKKDLLELAYELIDHLGECQEALRQNQYRLIAATATTPKVEIECVETSGWDDDWSYEYDDRDDEDD